MDFNHFLTSYMPDPKLGSKKHFQNMINQAILAEKLGYIAVSIPVYANTEMSTCLQDISVPSLVLTGENDEGCNPRLNKFIAKQIPNSKLIILSKCKHSLLLEAPMEVAENLIKFVNEIKN